MPPLVHFWRRDECDISSSISSSSPSSSPSSLLRQEWNAEAGNYDFPAWKTMRRDDKHKFFYNVIEQVHGLKAAYSDVTLTTLFTRNSSSIEHVLPRSYINGRDGGEAEDDPRGWWFATRAKNSQRGNRALVLWRGDFDGPLQTLHNRKHYVPPNDQFTRAMLARKWLFIRYHYSETDELVLPSQAQYQCKEDIFSMLNKFRPSQQEIEVNDAFYSKFGIKNPLVGNNWSKFLNDSEFQRVCFPTLSASS